MLRVVSWTGLLAATLAVPAGGGCGGATRDTHQHATDVSAVPAFAGEHPIRVVATTGPVADMLRQIGGDLLDVTGLMGPGVDPHLYRPVPSDIERLDAADIIFFNGLHLEGRMADLLERLARRKPVFAVTHRLVESHDERLRMPPEFEGYYDPHVWHDATLWSECVAYVVEVLSQFDPANRDEYMQRGESYIAQLREIDQYCREQIAAIPEEQRVLVTAHDAFGYFCLAYGLEGVPLGGISTEDEVSIGRMDEVIQLLVSRRIKAVFVETSVAPRIVRALVEPCRAAGHEVRVGGELYADALGPPDTGADTYIGMIRANVDTIVSALK